MDKLLFSPRQSPTWKLKMAPIPELILEILIKPKFRWYGTEREPAEQSTNGTGKILLLTF